MDSLFALALFANEDSKTFALLTTIGMFAAGVLFYMLPTIIGFARGHPNMAPIMIVNILLGWSCLGWVVALAWAFTAQERHRADYGRDDYYERR